jgi:8-oxo-dGTP diphosphatase
VQSTKSRKQVLVVAALIERDGQILVTQRRADQSLPLSWEFPGGKIEPGESPTQALQREIQEELGCSITVGEVEDVVFFAYDEFDLIMPVYWAKVSAGEPWARQVAALAWLKRETMGALTFAPADVPLVTRLASETRSGARAARKL